MLTIRLLGRPSLVRDGETITGPRGHKCWALLGMLIRSEEPISRRRLANDLFSEADDPLAALRWSLAELRRRTSLPDGFRSDPVVPALGESTCVDVVQIANGELLAAVPDGDFLEGIDVRSSPGFESWLLIERQRVDGEVLASLRQASLRAIAGRDFDRAIDFAGAMVRRAPYEEGSHVMLVKALADSGDAEGAIRQVEAAETLFRVELGVSATIAIRNAARPQIAASVPGVSAQVSAESLLEAGLAAVSAGAVDAGIECLRRAASDAEQTSDDELLSRCLMELGTSLVHSIRGFDDEGAVILESAAVAATAAGAANTAAKIRSELAYIDLLAGRRAGVRSNLEQAERLVQDDPSLLATIASFDAMNLADWGREDEAEQRFGEALDLARSSGVRRRVIWTLGIGARTLYRQGRVGDAHDWALEACRLVDEERWTAFRPWPETWLAHARLHRGVDPATVRSEAESTFARATQLQDPCWEGVSAKMIGLTYIAENDPKTGLAWMSNAGVLCGRVTDPYHWVEVDIQCAEARAAHQLGDHERAESVARQAIIGAARGQMDQLLDEATSVLRAVQAN
jgi:DNA-binding SARP family transcriptional activator